MNPVFLLLVILAGVIIWFAMNSLFPAIGNFICGLYDETKFNMSEKEQDEE